jgi:hypothetical protein
MAKGHAGYLLALMARIRRASSSSRRTGAGKTKPNDSENLRLTTDAAEITAAG